MIGKEFIEYDLQNKILIPIIGACEWYLKAVTWMVGWEAGLFQLLPTGVPESPPADHGSPHRNSY